MKTLLLALLAMFAVAMPVGAQDEAVADPEELPLFSQAELDQMLAPIALYPDQLLSQLLMAATYPLEIVQAARWSRANPQLKGQEAVRAVEAEAWDPSVKAMVAFPDILRRMDEDLEWTQSLGDSFLAQQQQVMDTVQALRARAEEQGNLQSDEHVEVVREERTIIVRDRYPDVVYVPWYSPYEVYGSWWWPAYRPVYWDPWPGYYRSSFFYWGPTIVIGHGFYYGHCDWRARRIRVVDAPPFYYRHQRPRDGWWAHEYSHRRGVPYRHRQVHDRYADDRARPPRTDWPVRPGRGRGLDTVTPVGYQPPAQPGTPPIADRDARRPGDRIGRNGEPVEDRDQGNSDRPGRGQGRGTANGRDDAAPDANEVPGAAGTPIVAPTGRGPTVGSGGVKVRPARPADVRPAQPVDARPEPNPAPQPPAGTVPSQPSNRQPIIAPAQPATEQPRMVRPVQRNDVPRAAPAQPSSVPPDTGSEPRAPRAERTPREPRPERTTRPAPQPRAEPVPQASYQPSAEPRQPRERAPASRSNNRSPQRDAEPQRNYQSQQRSVAPQSNYQAQQRSVAPQRSYQSQQRSVAPQRSYQSQQRSVEPQRSYQSQQRSVEPPQRSYDAPQQQRRSDTPRQPRAERESAQPRGERQREPEQANGQSRNRQRVAQRD